MVMSEKNYRSDIDGLRAVAVLSVFLHHLNPSILPGGYVGVDIFFVISGFLITGKIIFEKEIGEFSLKNFYQRRINRILPALLVVVIFTLIAGFKLVSPADWVLLVRSALYAILGSSNIFFWKEYGSYFSGSSSEAALLNTWSLGVEEQFYFIWPLLLILLLKILRQQMLIFLLILFLMAIVISEIGINVALSASYYLLPTRFFELMLGGLLSIICLKYTPRDNFQSCCAFIFGFAGLSFSLFVFDKSTSFPGVIALIPCIATALLIWSGSLPILLTRIIKLRALVFIGILSYSLYLWHWPLIAYTKYIGIQIDIYVGFLIFTIAFFLSYLTWKYIEGPFRRSGSLMKFKNVLTFRFILPIITLLALNFWAVQSNGSSDRFSSEVIALEMTQQSKPNELRAGCHVPTALYKTPLLDRCRLGIKKNKPDGILFGDSFANHFSGMIDVVAKRNDLSIVDYTMDGCPPINGFNSSKVDNYAKRCRQRNESVYSEIEARKFSHVILASNWPDTPEAGPLLVESIERLQRTGAHLTIILKNESIENGSTCPIRNAMYKRNVNCKKTPKGQPSYINDLQTKFSNLSFIDPNKVICGGMGCDPVLDGVLIYRDSVHLNDVGSRVLGQRLLNDGFNLFETR